MAPPRARYLIRTEDKQPLPPAGASVSTRAESPPEPAEDRGVNFTDGEAEEAERKKHEGVEVGDGEGWYRAMSLRYELDQAAMLTFETLVVRTNDLFARRLIPTCRWTNDPDAFPDVDLGIVPFPPNDDQLHAWRPPEPPPPAYDGSDERPVHERRRAWCCAPPASGTVKSTGRPVLTQLQQQQQRLQEQRQAQGSDAPGATAAGQAASADTFDMAAGTDGKAAAVGEGTAEVALPFEIYLPQQPWSRLVDFSLGGNVPGACVVFDDTGSARQRTHLGRVMQGQLENAYFVEALNAISLRPRLVQQMFRVFDVQRSIYIVRLNKNGTWINVEIDDYVPSRFCPPGQTPDAAEPFCCRSEYFPRVLWPSLVEKAYAKSCTRRGILGLESGGWEAIGGGGRVESALADLTGGVAGTFQTNDVAPDRLFIYLYESQRDCLFVCRVRPRACVREGVLFDATSPYIFNRAAHHEGHCFVQLFTSSTGGGDAGRSQLVPDELKRKYPEHPADGFFWLTIYDFAEFFGTIIECRLTGSPDVGLPLMPAPRLPQAYGGPPPLPHLPRQDQPLYFEHVLANPGVMDEHSMPEFTVECPSLPCEVVATVQQTDKRMCQIGPTRPDDVAILMKVYQQVDMNYYCEDIVCKSNWHPVRDSMVAFKAYQGGVFKIVVELPHHGEKVDRLIFRCYTSVPGCMVAGSVARYRHMLVNCRPHGPAQKWTLVGGEPAEKMQALGEPVPLPPAYLDSDLDAVRRAAQEQQQQQCALM